MLLRVISLSFIFVFQLSLKAYAKKNFPDNSSYEIRKFDSHWQIGNTVDGKWVPFEDGWTMYPVPFNTKNGGEIDKRGRGIQGKNVSIVTPPISYSGKNVSFKVYSDSIFDNQFVVPTGRNGKIILDKEKYKLRKKKLSEGPEYELYTEDNNPDADTIEETMVLLSHLFPKKAKRLEKATIVSVINEREDIKGELKASGFHRPPFVMLNSQEGADTFRHRLHELGGLFCIHNQYAHGLTWFITYDQADKRDLKESTEVSVKQALKMTSLMGKVGSIEHCFKNGDAFYKKLKAFEEGYNKNKCSALSTVMHHLRNSGGSPKAFKNSNINFHDLVNFNVPDSYGAYSWGSAGIWQLINMELEISGEPTVYDLLNLIHEEELDSSNSSKKNLADLKKSYRDKWGGGLFEKLVDKYFLETNTKKLYENLKKEKNTLDCE